MPLSLKFDASVIPPTMREAFGFAPVDPDQLVVTRTPSAVCAVLLVDWPLQARIMRRMRVAADVGVGDTIHRHLGSPGRWFESAADSLGLNCRCAERREWLNQRYPY